MLKRGQCKNSSKIEELQEHIARSFDVEKWYTRKQPGHVGLEEERIDCVHSSSEFAKNVLCSTESTKEKGGLGGALRRVRTYELFDECVLWVLCVSEVALVPPEAGDRLLSPLNKVESFPSIILDPSESRCDAVPGPREVPAGVRRNECIT